MAKASQYFYLMKYGVKTVMLKRKKPIIGCVILTDKCNLSCKHCLVKNITGIVYSYKAILSEMKMLYEMGVRILMFYGGETFLWNDGEIKIRDLVIKAKQMGFFIVNLVTNGTFPLDVPEADTILVSLDGSRKNHNNIHGNTFNKIMYNIRHSTSKNICDVRI